MKLNKIIVLAVALTGFSATVSAQGYNSPSLTETYGRGKADTVTVDTRNLASAMRVTVITPGQYDKNPQERYPTVYLLNGYSGSYRSWPRTQTDLDSLATVHGIIIVCPDGRDSWYWDAPKDPKMKMETFFIEDLVPYIDSHYRTVAKRGGRAITGLSMGGHGALWLAIRHSDVFGSAGAMSGGVDVTTYPERWKKNKWLGEYDADPQLWRDHAVINLVSGMKKDQLNITFDCGTNDVFTQDNARLHGEMLRYGIPHDYSSRPGGHNHPYWRNSILYHLQFFRDRFTRE